jgi:anti-sigma factor RsiW
MQGKGTDGIGPPGAPDRELWRRSQDMDATSDEADRFLDLAAFAENRLDDDETARVAALIARDPDAAKDAAAARDLAVATLDPADAGVIARATALVDAAGPSALVIAFPPRPRSVLQSWFSAARWSGLAAAVVLAGWLGFDLGSGLSNFGAPPRSPDDTATNELFDPSPLLLRDFTDNSQI